MAQVEREAIERALGLAQGNKSRVARLLQIDYKTLYAKLNAYGIDATAFRREGMEVAHSRYYHLW